MVPHIFSTSASSTQPLIRPAKLRISVRDTQTSWSQSPNPLLKVIAPWNKTAKLWGSRPELTELSDKSLETWTVYGFKPTSWLKLPAKHKWQLSFFFQGRSSRQSKYFKGKTKLEWPSSPLKFVGNETETVGLPAPSPLNSNSSLCWNQLGNSAALIIVRLWLSCWPSSNPSVPTRAKKQVLQAVGTHELEATL